LVLAAAALPATAQAQARFGAQLSYGDDSDLGIGVRVKADTPRLIPGSPLSFIGSFDWFFPGNSVDYFEINANLAYNFTVAGSPIRPYAGGGLNLARASVANNSNTELGLNILGGVNFRAMGRLQPFAEIRLELSGGEQFVLTGGFYF
jgi:outer membrane immunogenic protein